MGNEVTDAIAKFREEQKKDRAKSITTMFRNVVGKITEIKEIEARVHETVENHMEKLGMKISLETMEKIISFLRECKDYAAINAELAGNILVISDTTTTKIGTFTCSDA